MNIVEVIFGIDPLAAGIIYLEANVWRRNSWLDRGQVGACKESRYQRPVPAASRNMQTYDFCRRKLFCHVPILCQLMHAGIGTLYSQDPNTDARTNVKNPAGVLYGCKKNLVITGQEVEMMSTEASLVS